MRKWLFEAITAVAVLAAIVICSVGSNVEDLYARSMQVTGFDLTSNLVIVEDGSGCVWAFQGIEDWHLHDSCLCVMDSNGTEEIFDDRIVNVRYDG